MVAEGRVGGVKEGGGERGGGEWGWGETVLNNIFKKIPTIHTFEKNNDDENPEIMKNKIN